MATIRRVPNLEHHFQLVVTRVYEEGDQELLEDEDETDEERVFLISQELEFRIGESDGEPTLVWRDLDGDVDEFFEFVAPGTNEPTRAFFETCMYRAMYERKYKKSADNTRDTDFEEFTWHSRPSSDGVKVTPRRKAPSKTHAVRSPSTSVVASPLASEPPAENDTPPSPAKHTLDTSTELLISCEAELYSWDTNTERFNNQGIVVANIMRPKNTLFQYWLTAENDAGLLLAHQITQDMNQRFSHRMLSLTWNHQADDGSQSSWLFRFSEEYLAAFLQKFTECLWETLHQSSWAKLKADEQNYAVSANDDVEMRDVENDDDDEEEVLSELDPDEEPSDDEEDYDEDEGTTMIPGSDRNSQLTVGYKGDRSYVVRGNNIGVFNHSVDNGVKYYGSITKLSTPKGKGFKPKHVMLHDQDTKMVLMNPSEPHSLFSMDIERGKIVEEWKVHDDVMVDHIAPDNKFAQTTREQTLVGVSHNSLFRIDPRVSGNKMVENEYKQYVSKNKFSGVTTTANGRLAVASEKGDIRLFDSIGKNAKTALPPLGDPIIGIDVTADGRYIVATTKTYLLLIDTLIGEGRYQGSLGFDRSFPATAKPIPRRLQLRNEHVAYMGSISFTPAKFNQGPGKEENAIVTSSGQFVIAWDFKKVKKGYLDQYEIKKYEDHVVQDSFKFGDDKEIIVALDNNVLAINKKNLKKPNRHSLAPQGSFGSRSNIVNAPY
ncbi:hypothetical protein C0992_000567 [Termitomyces sp. T32_za158]|nr:hypothetical protein C0992_000567 [Termitomyces sp. T32_za158]